MALVGIYECVSHWHVSYCLLLNDTVYVFSPITNPNPNPKIRGFDHALVFNLRESNTDLEAVAPSVCKFKISPVLSLVFTMSVDIYASLVPT